MSLCSTVRESEVRSALSYSQGRLLLAGDDLIKSQNKSKLSKQEKKRIKKQQRIEQKMKREEKQLAKEMACDFEDMGLSLLHGTVKIA